MLRIPVFRREFVSLRQYCRDLIIDFKHFSQENVSFGDEWSDWKGGGDLGNPVKMPLRNFTHS